MQFLILFSHLSEMSHSHCCAFLIAGFLYITQQTEMETALTLAAAAVRIANSSDNQKAFP
jgi:hypothetical protein